MISKQVTITGWKVGVQSVSLILLLHKMCGISLIAGRDAVDRIVNGQSMSFDFESEEKANEFSSRATELGAICAKQI